MRSARTSAAGVVLMLIAIVSACSGGGGNHVATLGGSNASSASDSSSGDKQSFEDAMLDFAKCMRDHGVTDFPDDVTFVGNSPALFFVGSPNDPKMFTAGNGSVAVNLSNPTTKAAYDACQVEWQKLIA